MNVVDRDKRVNGGIRSQAKLLLSDDQKKVQIPRQKARLISILSIVNQLVDNTPSPIIEPMIFDMEIHVHRLRNRRMRLAWQTTSAWLGSDKPLLLPTSRPARFPWTAELLP